MFEFDQKTVDTLLEHDNQFKRLYEKHKSLKDQVHEAKAARRLAGGGRRALTLDLHAVTLAGVRGGKRCPGGAANP